MAPNAKLKRLHDAGVSIWLDTPRRSPVTFLGGFERLVSGLQSAQRVGLVGREPDDDHRDAVAEGAHLLGGAY
jgi:hypothetical protein